MNARHYHNNDSSVSLPLNRVIIARGSEKQLVYYWFEERGMKIANEYWSKLYLLRDAILKNRTDGALVRLTTPLYPGETESDADKRLQDFTQAVVPNLAGYLPSADTAKNQASDEPAQSQPFVESISCRDISANHSPKHLMLAACLVLSALQLAGCSSREQRAQSYYEHGMSYLEKQDFVKARIELRNAAAAQRRHGGGLAGLAQIDEHDQNWQGACRKLAKSCGT